MVMPATRASGCSEAVMGAPGSRGNSTTSLASALKRPLCVMSRPADLKPISFLPARK